jgi:NADP-dependent 3-hydroxy acid dehydrogenase YdfG
MRVIVTGASRGIGRGIASHLAREGFTVGLTARSGGLLDELGAELRAAGATCFAFPADVRDADSIQCAIESLCDALGGVDALVNNAGVVVRKGVLDISPDEWHAMIDTNVNGLFYATRAVLPAMVEQGSGHVINISSISGRLPLPGGSGYAASKFAVTGFTQSIFQELRDLGIKCTTIYPGSVDSQSHRHGPGADGSWKVEPEEVGQACRDVLRYSAKTLVSELEIRPRGRPPR